MESVDETDSSAELEDNEDILTKEADIVVNPSSFPGPCANSPSLPFALGSDKIYYDDTEESVKIEQSNFEERVNFVNDDWDLAFVDESLYNVSRSSINIMTICCSMHIFG